MRGGRVEYDRPTHELGEQDAPGPGEWLAVARRVRTLGAAAAALTDKIDAMTSGTDPESPSDKPKPNEDEPELILVL